MIVRVLATAALLCAASIAAAACPRPLTDAQLRTHAENGEIAGYVMRRWFTCGWPAVAPALGSAAEITREKALADAGPDDPDAVLEYDELLEALSLAVVMTPRGVIELAAENDDEPAEDDLPALAELLRMSVSPEQAAKNFEQGLAPAIAWMRKHYVLPETLDRRFELALIAQNIRSGDIGGARARFALAVARPVSSGTPIHGIADADEHWKTMQTILAEPVALSTVATGPGIRLDRSTSKQAPAREMCGTGALMERTFGLEYLRGYVLRAAPIDVAIDELLGQWREPVNAGGGEHLDLLVELLKKRYSKAELDQGFGDAIALLRNDDQVAGMNLFGRFIALPGSVLEDDATAPDGVRERRLENRELAEIVQRTALYRALVSKPVI